MTQETIGQIFTLDGIPWPKHFPPHSLYLPYPLYYTNKTLYNPLLLICLHTSVLLIFHIVHSSHMSQNYLFTILPRTLLGTGQAVKM